MDAFPQLKDTGGYKLLRVSEDNHRTLETIPALHMAIQLSIWKNVSTKPRFTSGKYRRIFLRIIALFNVIIIFIIIWN